MNRLFKFEDFYFFTIRTILREKLEGFRCEYFFCVLGRREQTKWIPEALILSRTTFEMFSLSNTRHTSSVSTLNISNLL